MKRYGFNLQKVVPANIMHCIFYNLCQVSSTLIPECIRPKCLTYIVRWPHLDHDILCGSHEGSLLIAPFKKQLLLICHECSQEKILLQRLQCPPQSLSRGWKVLSQGLSMAGFQGLATLPSGASLNQVSVCALELPIGFAKILLDFYHGLRLFLPILASLHRYQNDNLSLKLPLTTSISFFL